MTCRAPRIHTVVAALYAAILTIPLLPAGAAVPDSVIDAPADAATLDRLFAELARPGEDEGWRRAESDILRLWSRSGSAVLDLLHQRGQAALDEGDPVTAIGHLTALTDQAPDYAPGFVDRAAAFAARGDYGPAAADLARALQLEPRQFIALTQLGTMLEDMGDLPRARDAFRASLAIHPHQPEAQDAVTRLDQALRGVDA